jgi:thioredoxin 1
MVATGNLKHVDDNNFAELTRSGVVLVDFFAEWCGPCHMQTPILEALAKEMSNEVTILKLDIDKSQKTTAAFRVTSIPTMVLLHNGQEVQRIVGLRDADTLRSIIKAVKPR